MEAHSQVIKNNILLHHLPTVEHFSDNQSVRRLCEICSRLTDFVIAEPHLSTRFGAIQSFTMVEGGLSNQKHFQLPDIVLSCSQLSPIPSMITPKDCGRFLVEAANHFEFNRNSAKKKTSGKTGWSFDKETVVKFIFELFCFPLEPCNKFPRR